jgi:hypothetical protein
VARAGELLVVADDWSPQLPPRATPCTESCECLEPSTIDLSTGGLFAYRVAASGDSAERVADGVDDRGFYGRREKLSVIDAGGRAMIASTQSIDRAAELFTNDGSGWTRQMHAQAPIPTWIGALGTADRLAWIGAQPESAEHSTVQQLVAGVVSADAEERAAITDPVDRGVFVVAPVQTATGVTRTYLLQGVYDRSSGTATWDRFEILAIDAAWQ